MDEAKLRRKLWNSHWMKKKKCDQATRELHTTLNIIEIGKLEGFLSTLKKFLCRNNTFGLKNLFLCQRMANLGTPIFMKFSHLDRTALYLSAKYKLAYLWYWYCFAVKLDKHFILTYLKRILFCEYFSHWFE